jgi:hypothetical protein
MKVFKAPKGAVQFKIGSMDKLPYEAEEIKLYMVSGDPSIYIVPISEIPVQYIKTNSKIEDVFEEISLIDFQI